MKIFKFLLFLILEADYLILGYYLFKNFYSAASFITVAFPVILSVLSFIVFTLLTSHVLFDIPKKEQKDS